MNFTKYYRVKIKEFQYDITATEAQASAPFNYQAEIGKCIYPERISHAYNVSIMSLPKLNDGFFHCLDIFLLIRLGESFILYF